MWRTQTGVRTLKGAEAKLIRESLDQMCDMLREEHLQDAEQWEYDVRVFDQLACNQRIALLAEVARYLLTETDDYPSLNAINEGTVGAIYENIRVNIIIELDESNLNDKPEIAEISSWRSLILAACAEAGFEDLPDANNHDYNEWKINLDILEEQVLWDRDFENSNFYLDLSPETGKPLKDYMRIDDDYFTAIPADPTDKEVEIALETLMKLTR